MSGLLGSKPKAATPVQTVVRTVEAKATPTPRKVEAPTPVAPQEDAGALAESRRREAARQAARGGLASTVMAEDKLG